MPGDDSPQYEQIRQRLISGWNSWNTRSVLSQVLLPEGFAVNLAFKQHYWLEEQYLAETLIGRRGRGVEQVRPGPHAWDGSYTRLDLEWEQLAARIETAHDGDDLVILVTPLNEPASPVKLVVESALFWNRGGTLNRQGDTLLADLGGKRITVTTTAPHVDDFYVQTKTPYLAVELTQPVGIATGKSRSLAEIESIVQRERAALERTARRYGDLADSWLAIQAGVAWNLIYEPKHDRVVSTVGRLWNEEYGGYCLFGWDNFFLAYLTALDNRDLAFANVIEHLRGRTEEGFIPNDNRGNGSKSFDRSQPPVGALMVREIYKRYPERWFLAEVFDGLLAWNRWWMRARLNDGLLSYGSHVAQNPFNEPAAHTRRAAGYESGMDDSPMYSGVPFNPDKNTLELQDVGLNSLYLADCQALIEMAQLLERVEAVSELTQRAELIRRNLAALWNESTCFYLNRRADTGEFSRRLSPTLFYPLLAEVPSPERARALIDAHFNNPGEFEGEWILPSIARNDPDFEKQRYWKGAIWPPLNFLTYLSLCRYDLPAERARLAEKSLQLLMNEWRRKGYVSENYSSLTGTGDDARLSSDRFHSWGALFGIMAFIEAGWLPWPGDPLAAAGRD